jgi:hypothetical protein
VRKRKLFRLLCALTLFVSMAGLSAQAEGDAQNHFDLVVKALLPFLALNTAEGSAGNHALDLQATIVESSGFPANLNGARVQVAFEHPDKFRAEIPLAGGSLAIGRHNDRIWLSPGRGLQSLGEGLPKKPRKRKHTSGLFGASLTPAGAVFLPAFLKVKDAGNITLENENVRVLDLGLPPEIAFEKSNQWSARIWIRPENKTIAQLRIQAPDWSVTLRIDKTAFSISLPPETWEPTEVQRADLIEVPQSVAAAVIERALKQPAAKPQPSP